MILRSFSALFILSMTLVNIVLVPNQAQSDQNIFVRVGTSEILELNEKIGRFLIGDPTIVELTPIDDRAFYLVGKEYGGTTVQVFGEDKTQLLETLNKKEEDTSEDARMTIRERAGNLIDEYVPDGLRDVGAAFTEGLMAPFTAIKELGLGFMSMLKPLKAIPKNTGPALPF